MRGRFITIEGGEGAGKSTMMGRVMNWLEIAGHKVIGTREPGGTDLAEKLREILLDRNNISLSGRAELLLLFAARSQHLDQLIRPALARGDWVLCDRFTYATWAYQGSGRGMPEEMIASLEQAVHGDLQPDLTLLLDLPVKMGLERVSRRGNSDRIEQETLVFFERVRQNYLDRSEKYPERFVVVDATFREEEVWQQIERILQQRVAD